MSNWMSRTIVSMVGVVLFGVPAYAEKKSEAQYWAETGLRFATLHQHLSNAKCHESAVQFIGCVAGLNAAASMTQPRPQQLVPQARIGTNPNTSGTVVKMYGPLALMTKPEKTEDEPSFAAMFRSDKQEEGLQNQALQALYEARKGTELVVDFDALIDGLQSSATTPQNEALVAAIAINGYLESAVDPHTHINPEQQVRDQMSSSGDSFFGIGVELKTIGKITTVMNVYEGSPALGAGIRARDIFHQIGKDLAEGMKVDDIVSRIRGPEGTPVELVMRRGEQLVPITVKRGRINLPEASAKMVTDAGHRFIYLRLRGFMSQQSCGVLASEIERLSQEGAEGIILDLRRNGGGLLSQGACISGLFVGIKVVLRVKDLTNDNMQPILSRVVEVTDLPMITLIDAGSASASEIVAGALQDHQRSWIAGERSYGKATVQGPSDWAPGVWIYETVQRFYQPSGRTNQIVGIIPDFAIDPSPNATSDEKFAIREADQYKNALPPLGEPWQQPRPAEVAKIQNCAKSGRALDTFKSRVDAAIPPDYRLLVAQDLLACAL